MSQRITDPRIKRIRDQLYTPHGDNTTWAQEVEADLASLQSDLDRLTELENEPVELTVAGEQAVAADDDDEIPFAPKAVSAPDDEADERLIREMRGLNVRIGALERISRSALHAKRMCFTLSDGDWLPPDWMAKQFELLNDLLERAYLESEQIIAKGEPVAPQTES